MSCSAAGNRFLFRFFLLGAAFLLAVPGQAAQDTTKHVQTLAVMDIDARRLENMDLDVLRDALTVELQNSGKVRVMERSQMNTILKEQGFQQSGACNASECAVEMGKLLSVDRMVLGSLGKLGETWSMTLRLVNVQTGEVLTSVRDSRTGSIDVVLSQSVPQLASQLLADLAGAPRVAKSQPAPANSNFGEALFLVKADAFRTDDGLERLKKASVGLTPSEAYQLNEEGSMSRSWAWANIYPFLPVGSMIKGDWAGVGLIYLGWVPCLVAASNDNSSAFGFLIVAGYAWQIARPIVFANTNNDRLKKGLNLSSATVPTPALGLDAKGRWQGSLAWRF